jgi:periplasmic divalent cation tolerance protein
LQEYVQIITTTETKEDAEKIANVLVRKRLAACVQVIGPITSVYWWKEEIERTTEWLCVIKTRKDLYEEIEVVIRRNHSYETPEILVVPVLEGSKSYFSWLDKELR